MQIREPIKYLPRQWASRNRALSWSRQVDARAYICEVYQVRIRFATSSMISFLTLIAAKNTLNSSSKWPYSWVLFLKRANSASNARFVESSSPTMTSNRRYSSPTYVPPSASLQTLNSNLYMLSLLSANFCVVSSLSLRHNCTKSASDCRSSTNPYLDSGTSWPVAEICEFVANSFYSIMLSALLHSDQKRSLSNNTPRSNPLPAPWRSISPQPLLCSR